MDEVLKALRTLKLPMAYNHFAEGESPPPPFLCYLVTRSHNFFADSRVYQKVDRLSVELYSDRKDPKLEAKVEKVLSSFCWEKSEVFIESEKLYQIIYEIEV